MPNGTIKRSMKVTLTSHQILELELAFKKDQYPDEIDRAELAIKLKLSKARVQIWFQNQRAKRRKQFKKTVEQTNTTKVFPSGSPGSSKNLTSFGDSVSPALGTFSELTLGGSEPWDYGAGGYVNQLNGNGSSLYAPNALYGSGGCYLNNNSFGGGCTPYAVQPQDNPGIFSARQDQSPLMLDYFGHKLNKHVVDSYAMIHDMAELQVLTECDIVETLGSITASVSTVTATGTVEA